MNSLTIVCSPNLLSATKHTIKQIEHTAHQLDIEHIIVVPDRFSLQAENLVFDLLNINSTINISVVGISRLASTILQESGQSSQVLSTHQSVLLVRKVALQQQPNFLFFKKNGVSQAFSEELYATIQQLLSSKVSPQDLIFEHTNQAFKNKMHDISLIMQAYQAEINNKFIDSSQKLELFEKAIPSSQRVKNARYYFCQFDSFTEQGYAIFSSLCQYASDVYASVVTGNNQKNNFLLVTDVLEKIKQMDFLKGNIKIITAPKSANKFGEHILSNMLVSKPALLDGSGFLSLRIASSLEEEVLHALRNIKHLVMQQQMPLHSICISVAGLEQKKGLISRLFAESNIPFFIDSNQSLSGTSISQFLLTLLKTLHSTQLQDWISLFKWEWFNILGIEKFENAALKLGLERADITKPKHQQWLLPNLKAFEGLRQTLERYIQTFEQGIKKCNTVGQIVTLMQQWLIELQVPSHIVSMQADLQQAGNLLGAKQIKLSYDKVLELLQSILIVYENEPITLADWIDVFESGINAISFAQVPISADCVFIGDAHASYFPDCEAMFVLGASEGAFPLVHEDIGLISDREIEALHQCNIAPTIKMLNIRARYKVFQTLTQPNKKLYVSYAPFSEEKEHASSFMLSLSAMFGLKEPLPLLLCSDDIEFAVMQLADFSEFNHSGSAMLALPFLAHNPLQAEKLALTLKSKGTTEHNLATNCLQELLQFDSKAKQAQTNLSGAAELFFATNKTSVSKVSSYLTCPRLSFLRDGLQCKQREDVKAELKDVGNILHKIAELFVKQHAPLLGTLKKPEIKCWAEHTITQLLQSAEFAFFTSKKNAFVKKAIWQEGIALCQQINEQQMASKFRPTKFEQAFGAANSFAHIPVNLPDRQIYVSGVIDRIDEYENMFRIIDYKTGNAEQSFKKLFFGTNIQLMFYAYVARKALQEQFVGSFVYKISNKPTKKGAKNTNGMLIGFAPNDVALLKLMDSFIAERTYQDKQIDVSITASGIRAKETVVSVEELELLSDYAFKVLEQAVRDMHSGLIIASPIAQGETDLPCRYCFAKSVCPFYANDNAPRRYTKIETEHFRHALNKGEDNAN